MARIDGVRGIWLVPVENPAQRVRLLNESDLGTVASQPDALVFDNIPPSAVVDSVRARVSTGTVDGLRVERVPLPKRYDAEAEAQRAMASKRLSVTEAGVSREFASEKPDTKTWHQALETPLKVSPEAANQSSELAAKAPRVESGPLGATRGARRRAVSPEMERQCASPSAPPRCQPTSRCAAAPKLARGVFRIATVTNSGDWPLLAGTVDVFRSTGLVGWHTLERVAQGAPFTLTFGSDEALRVKRVTLEEVNDISVAFDAKTTAGFTVNATSGVGAWTVPLMPQEKRSLELRFTIDVPTSDDTGGP